MLVIGIQTDSLFSLRVFKPYQQLQARVKGPSAWKTSLAFRRRHAQKDSLAEKLNAVRIFPDVINDQTVMDSCRSVS